MKKFAVMDKEFSYNYYAPSVIKVGDRIPIGPMNRLIPEGLVFVVGHGANEVIPNGYFHLEEEVIERVEHRVVRRVAF